MSRRFDVSQEPREECYDALVTFLERTCWSGQLVVRHGIKLEEAGREVLARLAQFGATQSESSTWPGTVLHGHTASVVRFSLRKETLAILQGSARGLYDWLMPALPEDLAAFREDGSLVLGSIAHEADAFLELTDSEAELLVDSGLAECVSESGS
jgi:hypothetical protein